MANWFVSSAGSTGNTSGTGVVTSWATAWTSLAYATATNGVAAGDTIFVADNHSEVAFTGTYANPGTPSNPCHIICADHTVTTPVTSSYKTGGVVGSATAVSIAPTGSFDCYGLTFSAGAGTSAGANIAVPSGTSQWQSYEACVFFLNNTAASTVIFGGAANSGQFLNCSVKFGAITQYITASGVLWEDSIGLASGSSIPAGGLFAVASKNTLIRGVDFSAMGATKLFANAQSSRPVVILDHCKLGTGLVLTAASQADPGFEIYLVNCDSGTGYYRNEKWTYAGNQVTSTGVYRSGGASDGTTPLSWLINTTAYSFWASPFWNNPIAIWNTLTGSNQTVTLYGVINAASLPNNDQFWFDVRYFGSASTPIESTATGSKANLLASGSALSADTSTWVAPARANSTAVVLGGAMSVADNAGRVFFCTTAGTTSGSEPGGLSTATDGSTPVTDGTAAWRAGCRFSQTVTLGSSPLIGSAGGTSPQPQAAGYVYADAKAALASATFYLDPLIVL
jgi:hypothetical protein